MEKSIRQAIREELAGVSISGSGERVSKKEEIPSQMLDAKRRFNAAEHLVHTTKKNPARFDFDLRFPKMPSYLRRAAIQHALGSVSSYETRMELWEKSGEKAGKPRLAYENHAMPVFYRDVMYREEKEGKDEAYLKLYDGHDWKWFCVRLNHTDMEYLRRNWWGKKASAPTLEKRHHKYFLRFSYTEEVTLTKTPVKEQIICSVDLGINTDAVCTIMRADGTVLGRKFINHPSEKDRMYRALGRIRISYDRTCNLFTQFCVQTFRIRPSSLCLRRTMFPLESADPSQRAVHPVFFTGMIYESSSQDSSVCPHDSTDCIGIDP